jgi:DNA invertase Pin-like site-specific DNA recombinase
MKRAGIYVRVSVDRDRDKATIERQEADCRALAEHRGFEVVQVFPDRNLSAFKRGVVREQYDLMKEAVTEGRIEVVLAYRLDRLSRSLSEALKLIELLDDHGAGLALVNGDVDTTTRMGKAFFQISAVFAELEAATTSDRLISANAAAAEKGLPPTGGRRCFGFVGKGPKQGRVIPEEKAYLLMAAADIRDGLSLRQVTRRMNERGSLTTSGNAWSPRSLVKCLKSPRMRGKRTHQPDPKVPPTLTDGHYKDGTPWEVIFEEGEHLDLIYLIDKAGETYRDSPRRRGNAHLLTGLAKCSLCRHRLGYGRVKKGDTVRARYTCRREPGRTACGGVSIAEEPLDRYVIGAVREFGHLHIEESEQKRRTLEDAIEEDERALGQVEQTLDDLMRDRYSPEHPMTDAQYASLRAPLVARRDELQAKLASPRAELERLPSPWSHRGYQATVTIPEAVDGRAWLRRYLTQVEIMPARKRGVRFSGTRVRLHWIDGTVTTDDDLKTEEDDEAQREYNRIVEDEHPSVPSVGEIQYLKP